MSDFLSSLGYSAVEASLNAVAPGSGSIVNFFEGSMDLAKGEYASGVLNFSFGLFSLTSLGTSSLLVNSVKKQTSMRTLNHGSRYVKKKVANQMTQKAQKMMLAGIKTATSKTVCYAAEKGTAKVLENTESECLKKCLPKVIGFAVHRSVGNLEETCDSILRSSKSEIKESKGVVKEIVKDVTTHAATTCASYAARTATEELVKDKGEYMKTYLPGIVECATGKLTSDVCKTGLNSGDKTCTEILQEVKDSAKDTAKDVTKKAVRTATLYHVQKKAEEFIKDKEGYMKECLPGELSYAAVRCTSGVCDLVLNSGDKTATEIKQKAKDVARDTAKDILTHTATNGALYVVQQKAEELAKDKEGYMKECLPGELSYAAVRCTSGVCDLVLNSADKTATEIKQKAKNVARDTAKDILTHTATNGASYVVQQKAEELVKDKEGYTKECLPGELSYAAVRCTSGVCDLVLNSADKTATEIKQTAKNVALNTAKDILTHTATNGASYVVQQKAEELVKDKEGYTKECLPGQLSYAAGRCTSGVCDVVLNSADKTATEIKQTAKIAVLNTAKDIVTHTATTGYACDEDEKGFVKECSREIGRYALIRCASEVYKYLCDQCMTQTEMDKNEIEKAFIHCPVCGLKGGQMEAKSIQLDDVLDCSLRGTLERGVQIAKEEIEKQEEIGKDIYNE